MKEEEKEDEPCSISLKAQPTSTILVAVKRPERQLFLAIRGD